MELYIDLFNHVKTGNLQAVKSLIDNFSDFEVNSILDEVMIFIDALRFILSLLVSSCRMGWVYCVLQALLTILQ